MTNNIEAYPLYWPPAWPRTAHPQRALFDTSFAAARDSLFAELRLMGAKNIILSTNIELRHDGLPYAGRTPDDPAVAVYFDREGVQQCIPCNKWNRAQDNVQAVRKTVEALRGLERWGAKSMVDAAFQGFKALPASIEMGAGSRSWWEVLGVSHTANPVEIKRAYVHQAQRWHPDKPEGDATKFNEIKAAYEQAISMGTHK